MNIGIADVCQKFAITLNHRTVFWTRLDVATCGVTNATSFYALAPKYKFSHLVANLAPKIGDFLLWENIH